MDLKSHIRDVPGFPKPGIVFKDITTLLKDKTAFREAVDQLAERFRGKPIDLVACVEARGFTFGAALAYKIGTGVVIARKPKKLPAKTIREEYALEYGTDALELHEDAIQKGQRVLVLDDLLATGGTALATVRLVEKLGGQIVGVAFVIELAFLKGREKLGGYDVQSLIRYDQE
jgi:adenine phosphoribosyltransferase